ncbi:uncharacterized protein LOC129960782 isoform X2 [Argiope bruennichi]|nr:uncharacterized protein LOC129960782 isoform X2 [Argiope bruennichi]
MLKNAWCKKCNLKRKSNVPNEMAHNAGNQNFHSIKNIQPIIPYRSLKTIKNIFKNSGFICPWKVSCAQYHTVSKRCGTHRAKNFIITPVVRDPLLPFINLSSVNICKISLNKMDLLNLLKGAEGQNLLHFLNELNISQATLVVKSSVTKLNELSLHMLQESSDSIPFHETINSENNLEGYATALVNSSQAVSEENSLNDTESLSDCYGIDVHFRMPALADHLDNQSPCLEPSDGSSSFLQNNGYVDALKYYFSKKANLCDVNNSELCTETDAASSCLETKIPIVQKENAFIHHKLNSYFADEGERPCLNSNRALDMERHHYYQNESFTISQSFNPLDTLETSHVETSLLFPDVKSDKHVESITSSNIESCSSDDEIYYSDEETNEIFLSGNYEKFNFSRSPLEETEQSCLSSEFSENTSANSEMKRSEMSDINQCNLICRLDSEEKAIIHRNEFKYEHEIEQKLLKVSNNENDNINFINVRRPHNELPFISYHHLESTDENYVSEQKENYQHFPKFLNESKSGLLIKPYSLAEHNTSVKVTSSVAECTEKAEETSSEIYDKKWLFYWGDNHNFIARTWQKDFVPVEKKENHEQYFYDAKVSTALCKEIKEEEDELLKGLCSVPAISNSIFGNELCKPMQNDLHSSYLTSQIESFANCFEENTSLYVQAPESQRMVVNQIENYVPMMNNNFTFDNFGNKVPHMQHTSDHSISFENNPFKAANFSGLSAFSNASGGNNSYKDYYMEGGGWSLASDSFTDYNCDNPYERSCSLSELELEKPNNDCVEYLYQKRQRCTSETVDVQMASCNEASNLYKNVKQKLIPRKRPCCFFLQGTCTRSDCRFSHDLSTTTCRFWRDGSCFKGETCPFLHGYVKENDTGCFRDNTGLRARCPELSFSLESETDFPSLSSVKTEGPKAKTEAINITQVKDFQRKQREK